jgi:hypothetical protein
MISPRSRYVGVDTATVSVDLDGEQQVVRYLRRRFVPSPKGTITLVRHLVKQGDRVDNLAALYFTDPTQFWRICDANQVLEPDELVDAVGRSLAIILPLR